MSDLKGCPFCGKRPILVAAPKEKNEIMYVVLCSSCCVTLPKPTEQEAKDAWNRRADNDT